MRGNRRPAVTDGEDWLSTEEAAELWNRILDIDQKRLHRPITGRKMRELGQKGVLQERGIRTQKTLGRYIWINRTDLLRYIHERAADAVRRAEAEMGRAGRAKQP